MGIAIQIEDAMVEARIISSTLLAVNEALYNGSGGHEEYEWAVLGILDRAAEHTRRMEALTNTVYAMQREKKEE